MSSRFFVALAACCSAATAYCGPTQLIAIPVADILGQREAFYAISATGNEHNIDPAYIYDQGLEFGINDVGEVGYDNDLLGHTVLNWKVQVYHTVNPSKFALSVGMQNIGLLHGTPDKYAVARYDLKAFRVHWGVLYNDRSRLMLGLDAPINKTTTFMVDFTSGPGSRTWTGVQFPLGTPALQMILAAGIPGDHRDGIQNMLEVLYFFKT